jgi:hypothetical protein
MLYMCIIFIREVSHKYENDNEHVITLWVRVQIMTSSRVISFRQVRDVPNEHDFVDLLRYVGIFHLQMLYHLIIWKRIDDVFVIVIVLSLSYAKPPFSFWRQ